MQRYNYEDDNDDMKSDHNSPHVSFGPAELNKDNILYKQTSKYQYSKSTFFPASFSTFTLLILES